MTENEIIKALECHKSNSLLDCEKCPLYAKKLGFETCHIDLFNSLYDLINRQKAEIENMQKTIFRKEDLMHMLCSQKQVYYDELVSAKAELERLQKECEITRAYIHNNGLEWGLVSHLEFYKNQRAEAIKEFAERLKEEQEFFVNECDDFVGYVAVSRIDNLVKEMEKGK